MSILKLEEIKSLQGTGNTVITFDSSDRAVFAQPPLTAVPAFLAINSTNQNVTSGVTTKVTLDISEFDTNNYFDTSNSRYLPLIPGYYSFTGSVRCNVSSNMTAGIMHLYKNGSLYTTYRITGIVTGSSIHLSKTSIIYMNGTTDYVELYGSIAGTSPYFQATVSPEGCSLEGFLVRAV